MAEIVGGLGTSHVPTIGVAVDHGYGDDPDYAALFAGYEPARRWVAELRPDVTIVVYNDHAVAFPFDVIPTFAIGVAPGFAPADEGYGPRPVPYVEGAPDLAWHLAESLILDEFDITIVNEMVVDHGLTVPLSVAFGSPGRWPSRVIPLAVNVIQYPPPTARRCFRLGQAIRRAVGSFEGAGRVLVIGTGGLSHQLAGERAGWINAEFDNWFLDVFTPSPESLAELSHAEYIRRAGSEGIEMIMWLVMRGALAEATEVHRHYHYPISNTAAGLIALEAVGRQSR